MKKDRSIEERAAEALAFAQARAGNAGSWIELHNALFGLGGKGGELFANESDRTAFSKTPEFKAIFDLVEQLRTAAGDPPADQAENLASANGRILVRVPRSLHAALLAEAEAEGVSLNQIILAKLALQLRALV